MWKQRTSRVNESFTQEKTAKSVSSVPKRVKSKNKVEAEGNEDKGVTKRDTLGGTQKLTFINESGLFIFQPSSHIACLL